jgi:Xaa-Pro aminopeptidase
LFSDLTVDFVFGEASDPQKDLYYGVLEVQKGALKNLKVGVDGYQLCSQAKQRIKDICSQKNIEGEMLHRLGHGGGFYIHDGPSIDDSLNFIIPDGLVTTIEPGCYVPGWGGVRIEDVVYVTKGGLEIFTFKAPKDRLIEIPV